MKLNRSPILTINCSYGAEVEKQCSKLYADGYEIIASNCGFADSEKYDFCSSYQAIFKDKTLSL